MVIEIKNQFDESRTRVFAGRIAFWIKLDTIMNSVLWQKRDIFEQFFFFSFLWLKFHFVVVPMR